MKINQFKTSSPLTRDIGKNNVMRSFHLNIEADRALTVSAMEHNKAVAPYLRHLAAVGMMAEGDRHAEEFRRLAGVESIHTSQNPEKRAAAMEDELEVIASLAKARHSYDVVIDLCLNEFASSSPTQKP